jgi:hypothetical protein
VKAALLFAALLLPTGGGLVAAEAATVRLTFPRLLECADAADRPLCLLRRVAAHNPEMLTQDSELGDHPALLSAAGVAVSPERPFDPVEARARLAAWKAQAGPLGSTAVGAQAEAEVAAREAMHLHRAGRPPDEALASTAALSLTEAPGSGLTNFDMTPVAPRAWAYQLLASSLHGAAGPREQTLRSAVMAAWERDLTVAGDDPARIAMLVETGQLERAAAVSAQARIDGSERRLRDSVELMAAIMAAREARWEADRNRELEELLREVPARQRARVRRELQAPEEIEPEPGEGAPDLRAMAEAQLEGARIALASAALKGGRADLARTEADRLLAPARLTDGLLSATHILAPAASPAVATRWLETLEATLRPHPSEAYQDAPRRGYPGVRSRSQVEAETRGTQLLLQTQASFSQVANGWRALGRTDRVEAMIQRWTPQALAEAAASKPARARGGVAQTPYAGQLARLLLDLGREDEARAIGVLGPSDWIRHDIKTGRGVDQFDAHLARSSEPNERSGAWITCYYDAIDNNRFDAARACWLKGAQHVDTLARQASRVQAATAIAGAAARAGDLSAARDMLDRALVAARSVPWEHRDIQMHFDDPRTFDVLDIAKAELRADGRLPAKVGRK